MSYAKVTSVNTGIRSFRATDLDVTPQQVKGGEGNVYGFNIVNPEDNKMFVKFYDELVGDVTVGTTVPIRTVQVESGGSLYVAVTDIPELHFETGLTIAATELSADTDDTNATADMIIDITYA